MRWWLTSRRAPLVFAAALLCVAGSSVIGGLLVPTPNLTSAPGAAVPMRIVLPLIVPATALYGLSDVIGLERAAVRDTRLADALLLLALGSCVLGAGLAAQLAGGSAALVAARNATGYLGLATLAGVIAGPVLGTLVPAAYVVGLALLGTGRTSTWWISWPLHALHAADAALIAGGLMGVGALAVAWGGGVRISALDSRGEGR